MKIIVLGGFGFIGSRISYYLKKKHKVLQVSRRNGFNIFKKNKIKSLFKKFKPDVVVNCASSHGGLDYINFAPATTFKDNSKIYFETYNAVAKLKKKPLILNLISNCAYYHNLDIQNEEKWLNGEAHSSVQPFAMSKRIAYYLSLFYFKEYKVHSKNFIIPNAYGPGDYLDPKRTHALNGIIIRFIKSIKEKKKSFEIWGTGKPKREWIFVDDIAKLILSELSKNKLPLISPINFAQNKSYSILKITNLVKKNFKLKINLKIDNSKIDGAPLKQMGNKKFKKFFGNFKFVKIEKGIRETIIYYKKKLS